jgi:hypothetical protein
LLLLLLQQLSSNAPAENVQLVLSRPPACLTNAPVDMGYEYGDYNDDLQKHWKGCVTYEACSLAHRRPQEIAAPACIML